MITINRKTIAGIAVNKSEVPGQVGQGVSVFERY